MSARFFLTVIGIALCVLLTPSRAFAGPPFLTDDPQPVDVHNYEFYIFEANDQTKWSHREVASTEPQRSAPGRSSALSGRRWLLLRKRSRPLDFV